MMEVLEQKRAFQQTGTGVGKVFALLQLYVQIFLCPCYTCWEPHQGAGGCPVQVFYHRKPS